MGELNEYDRLGGLFFIIHSVTLTLSCPGPCFAGFFPAFAGRERHSSGLCLPFCPPWGHAGRSNPFLRAWLPESSVVALGVLAPAVAA